MSEQLTPSTPPAVSQPDPGATVAPAGQGSGAATPAVPAGYVPQTDLDRVEGQRRQLQSSLDQLQSRFERLESAFKPDPEPTSAAGGAPQDFDPDKFASSLLDRFGAYTALTSAASELKTEFPMADPEFFVPDMLREFGSVEALRAAVEADHKRVQAQVDAALAAAGHGGATGQPASPSPLGPAQGAGVPVTGGPTVEQLARLSPDQLREFIAKNPGVDIAGMIRQQMAAAA